jgi:hypothetical protein
MAQPRLRVVGFLTFEEAAALCGCSEETLRREQQLEQLLVISGADGPDSDRIHTGDLAAFLARWRIARQLEP